MNIEMVDHPIQRDLIDRLMHSDGLKFSELKPNGMESNIFMYHLNSLIKSGYITKTANLYSLTAKGLTYVDSLSSSNLKPRKQPKLIAIIAVKNKDDEWLLLERKFQPYKDQLMLPSGKQHFGESIATHANRELFEKTGLDVPLSYRGMANISMNEDSQVLTHVVAHIHTGFSDDIKLPAENDKFKFVLHNFKDNTKQLMPGTREIYKLLISDESIFITNLEF
ncbi:MAG TPA: NUDIX hydrolase [Candidatus Saccharimonadales bacterium]